MAVLHCSAWVIHHKSIRHWLCRVCCWCWCCGCCCGSFCCSCSLLLLRLWLLWVWLWLRLLVYVPCQARMAMSTAALRAYIPNTVRHLLCMAGLCLGLWSFCLGAVVSLWCCLSRCFFGCLFRYASVRVSLCSCLCVALMSCFVCVVLCACASAWPVCRPQVVCGRLRSLCGRWWV
jgi:hypothetical protein